MGAGGCWCPSFCPMSWGVWCPQCLCPTVMVSTHGWCRVGWGVLGHPWGPRSHGVLDGILGARTWVGTLMWVPGFGVQGLGSWVGSWVLQGAGCGGPQESWVPDLACGVLGGDPGCRDLGGDPGVGSWVWGPRFRVSPQPDDPVVPPQPVLIQRGRFGRFLGRIRRFRPRINFDIRARGSIRLG